MHILDGDCAESEHLCDTDVCIPKSEVCDGKYDCDDKTDEMGCDDSQPAPSEHEGMYKYLVSSLEHTHTHKHTFAHMSFVLHLITFSLKKKTNKNRGYHLNTACCVIIHIVFHSSLTISVSFL